MMKDKKIAGTQASTITSSIGSMVGGYYGGYPGAMMGMALGSLLFKPEDTAPKDYSNTDYKQNKSRLDPVPDVIGTDICPGKVIYFNKDTFGVYSSDQLPSMGDSINEEAWKVFIDMMASYKQGYWAEFAVNFANRYLPGSEYHIGVVRFNRKPFWFWLILSDMFENYDGAFDPYDPISILDAAQNSPGGLFNRIDIEAKIGQDVNFNTVMYFRGFLADFTALSTNPKTSNVTIDVNNLVDMNPNEFTVGALQIFPAFSSEMNRDDVWMAPESMQGGSGSPPTTYYSFDDPYENYTLSGSVWNQRDARNNYFVGVTGTSVKIPVYYEGADRKWCYPGNIADKEHKEAATWLTANITTGAGTWLQSTDVHDDRVYICVFRNWENPYAAVAPTINHHHAEYGIEFDLYYHDRTDPTQKVISVLYNNRYSTPEGEGNANPRLFFHSMQVDDIYVYLFGGRVQTDFIWTDRRHIVAGANSYTKIYADFSQYPDQFWNGYYAALGQNGSQIWRQITEQTSTYITVANDFAALPAEGSTVYLSKSPKTVVEWGIVGEGSTKTEIICNIPGADDWWGPGVTDWEYCFQIGEWIFGSDILSISDTKITLASELQNVPVPGERICFGLQSSLDFDQDVVNPLIPEYISFLWDMGFTDPGDALGNVRLIDITNNEFEYSHHICWRINKNTGAMTVFDSERVTHPHRYAYKWWTGGINVFTCATDKQAFVYSHESQYGTVMGVYSYIIDFSSGIEEEIHRRNNYAGSHTPAWCYMGCVPVKEWNSTTQQYEDVWYTLLKSFDSSNTGLVDVADQGTYLLRLGDGEFSNKEIIADAINVYYGLDLDRRNISKLLYRKDVSTGPLYSGMYTTYFPTENQYLIGKFGITEDIYFYIQISGGMAGTGLSAGPFETWKYEPASELNPAGELYCIAKSDMHTDEDNSFEWLAINSGGYFRQSRYGFYGNGMGRWYMCDESPPKIIHEFWENYTDPSYFPPNTNQLLYDDALAICNEIIDTTIYSAKENFNIRERRFQFSQCFDQPRKMHDVINEILATCQGFISPCKWLGGVGRFKIIVPNADEVPVIYFGLDSADLSSNQLSDTYDYIYADFSAYPDDYWKGDLIDLGEQMEFDYPSNPPWGTYFKDWVVVLEQTSTYIKVDSPFVAYYPNGKQFNIKKDNIKEGSFTFGEKTLMNRPNKVRIEFKNRLAGYVKDVAEAEDTYRLEILGEEERIDFHKMHGIKRATQAGRMALRILDQWNYQKHKCAFDTDLIGMLLCVGDIIGVSHDTTGWSGKWFRVVSMDEQMDFEVKLALEEFNPYCYHDAGVPVITGYSYVGFPSPYIPRNVERFNVIEDIEYNRLYFTFKAPTDDAGFFVGARIYRQVGTEWEFIAIVNETVSSVKLAQDVGINDTTIYYDNDTISGSFPTEGVIWIENELMYYHGLDTVNHAFTNVVRGYKDTDQVEHLVENSPYIILKSDATVYYEIPDSWAGTNQVFRASAFTIQSLTIAVDISPSSSIDVVGYGVLPYFPESIQNKLPEFESLFESIGLGDVLEAITIEQLVESLGLGDAEQISMQVFVTEILGLNDTDTIAEFLLAVAESLGLGDEALVQATEFITETLGLGDTDSIAEMLLAISESLGLGDDLEAIDDSETFDLETDFSEYATSSPPGDWTEHWHVTTFQMDIVTSPADTGGKALEFDMTTLDNRATVSWDDGGNFYNTEVLCKVRWGVADSYHIGPAVRISGDDATETGYVVWLRDSIDEILLSRYDGGSGANLATYSISLVIDTWYWVRLQAIENVIKVKIWADGDSEPGSWHIDHTDSSRIYSMGKVGLGNYSQDGYCDEYKIKLLDDDFDYKTDFIEYVTSSPPGDWTEHWHTGNFSLNIVTSGGLSKDILFFDITSSERMACSWDDVPDAVDVEILTCITSVSSAVYNIGPAARISGSDTTETGYIIWADFLNDQIILRRYDAGTGSSDLATYSFTFDTSSWYWIKMRVVGDNIKAKVWSGGRSLEPGSWHIDYDDASPVLSAGKSGLGNYSSDGYVHFFGVNILDGEDAAMMVLNNNLL